MRRELLAVALAAAGCATAVVEPTIGPAWSVAVAARRRVDLVADAVAVARRQRDVVAKFVAVGEKARFEVDRADAEVAKAQSDEATARAEARAKELALAFAVGFDRPVALQLKDGL